MKKKIDKEFIEIFSEYLIDKMKDEFPTKKDISHLPNKEEFFTSQDKLVKETVRINEKLEKLKRVISA